MSTTLTPHASIDRSRFTNMGKPARVWSISAIHGDAGRLVHLHDLIFPHITSGDRLVYHGNYLGHGTQCIEVIDEILAFRRCLMANRGMQPGDIIYLRGMQEEMLQKLLQLQFAPNPAEVLNWMLANGLYNTLTCYGINPDDGKRTTTQGMSMIAKWTTNVRSAVRAHPGHETFATHIVRAAFTDPDRQKQAMLFVNSGINPSATLQEQGDQFWLAHKRFDALQRSYAPFAKIIRGYDPLHHGLTFEHHKISLDGGCGFGGTLVCAAFDGTTTDLLDLIEC